MRPLVVGGDEGAGSILVLISTAIVAAVALGCAYVVSAVLTHTRVDAAADLTALAVAGRLLTEQPCEMGKAVARRNEARLVSCEVKGVRADVVVEAGTSDPVRRFFGRRHVHSESSAELRLEGCTEPGNPLCPFAGKVGALGVSFKAGDGSPEEIINAVVRMAARFGFSQTPDSVRRANHRHGPTVNGGRSDHQGPGDIAWAADLSNGFSSIPQMDSLARAIANLFGLSWDGASAVSTSWGGFRVQMIYRSNVGGNHFNHIHLGIRG